jgi:hypothetical protein
MDLPLFKFDSTIYNQNGAIAYNAYKNAVDGKTWNGEDMKDFKDMPDKIKNAWCESASMIVMTTSYSGMEYFKHIALSSSKKNAKEEEIFGQNGLKT